MNFGEKLRTAIKKIKTKLIAYLVLIIVIDIIGIAPLTVSIEEAKMAFQAGDDFAETLFTQLFVLSKSL